MTLVLIFTSAALLVAVSILGALVAARLKRQALGPSLVGKTVVISTHPDDQGFRGVVLAEHSDRVTLHQAFTGPLGDQPVGGVVHLYRKDFTAVQQIEAA